MRSGLVAAIMMDRRNIFYLAGTGQPCILLITPGHPPILYARRVADWVRAEAAVEQIHEATTLRPAVEHMRQIGLGRGRIGLELDVLPSRLYLKAREVLAGFEIEDVSTSILDQRMVKDEFEQQQLRRAAAMFEALHQTVLGNLRPGMRELDIAADVVRSLRLAGHEGISFYRRWDAFLQPEGIVASGTNLSRISGFAMTVTGVGLSRALPWGASERVLRDGDSVVIDLGLNRAGYHADMSRTYVVGKAGGLTKEIFAVVLECQQAAIKAIKPGVFAQDIYAAALKVVAGTRWERHFQGYGTEQASYIGHGVGLDLDEPPLLAYGDSTPLQVGMALTAEPKLIGSDFGASQIEDTLLVCQNGAEVIGTVPRELFEVQHD
jgi:Xaa-Pro dipeptidase